MRKTFLLIAVVILLIGSIKNQGLSIEDFGAESGRTDVGTCSRNAIAIQNGFKTLNNTGVTLYVPEGSSYCIHPILIYRIQNVVFQISGNLLASTNITAWPVNNLTLQYQNLLEFTNCTKITITGAGQIIGFGYDWWLATYTGKYDLYNLTRPYLIYLVESRNFLLEQFTMWDAPYYNIITNKTSYVEIRDMFILVNTTKQRSLFLEFDNITYFSQRSYPLFPLNTDGIDPSGKYFNIHNVTIKNYDDGIAVKPENLKGWGCSENMVARDLKVIFSVGMSIGSVPPTKDVNCIRNISFYNIDFQSPIKGVYVKTNSGDPNGTGIIQNINYVNISMVDAIWYSIYIGPQQQKQPNGDGDGWWPPTQPLVSVDNITLTNVVSERAFFFKYGAGVLRCNVTNPCKYFDFTNVTIQGWAIKNWACEQIYGFCKNCTPDPGCIKPVSEYDPKIHEILAIQEQEELLNQEIRPKDVHYEYRPFEEIRERIEQIERDSSVLLREQEEKYLKVQQWMHQEQLKSQFADNE